jgi:hypothetical protein
MRKTIAVVLFVFTLNSYSQTYIKFNGVTALVGVPNIGIETSIGKKINF